ncbi:MAG: MFS transporter [Treponema sp.]|nr:MFS transporter [Treponema sp.]
MTETKKMPRQVRWLWSIGDAGFAAIVMISLNYFAPFLTDYAKFSLPMVALILALCNGIDTVASPFTGIFIERIRMPWGKFRSWLLVGGIIVFVFNTLQYTRVSVDEKLAAIIIVLGSAIGRTIWNVAFTSDAGLIPNLAGDNQSDYNFLFARRQMWQFVGRLLFSVSGVPLIGMFAGLLSPSMAIFFVAVIFGLLMTIGWWIQFAVSKGYEAAKADSGVQPKVTKWVDMVRVLKNGPLWVLIIAATLRDLGMFTGIGFGFYYFRYVWNNIGAFGIQMTASSIWATVISIVVAKILIDKLGPKKLWVYSAFLSSIVMIIVRIFARNAYFMIGAEFVTGVLWISAMPVHPMLFTDAATYAEWKTGVEARGFILGLGNINTKLAVFLSGLVLSSTLIAIKFVPDVEQSTEGISALNSAFCLIPVVFYLIHALVMIFGYRLTDEKIANMKAEIAAKTSPGSALSANA